MEESLDVSERAGLPSIVFRCIDFLEKKHAEQEEGIYRLSGSSAVIKALKDRFNNGESSIPSEFIVGARLWTVLMVLCGVLVGRG